MKSLLTLSFLPLNANAGLLVLRLMLGIPMLAFHGVPKAQKLFADKIEFADPLHIGVVPSLILAVLAEVVGSALLILGVYGRLAALFLAVTMGVAFGVTHHMKLSGPGNGELAYVYLAGFLVILLSGTGKYSLGKGGA